MSEVCVYRNLRNGLWSIAEVKGNDNRGKLIGHAPEVALINARFVVKESRRAAIAAGAPREVCAYVIGRLSDAPVFNATEVTFKPHSREDFFVVATGESVTRAAAVEFKADKKAYAYYAEGAR